MKIATPLPLQLGYLLSSGSNSIKAWFDATQVNGANAALPSNGASVSSWKDLSGNSNTVTQGNGARQPTFATNIQNGLPALYFPADNSNLNNVALNNYNTTNGHVIAAVKLLDTTQRKTLFSTSLVWQIYYRESFNDFVGTTPLAAGTTTTIGGTYTATANLTEFYYSVATGAVVKFNGTTEATAAMATTGNVPSPNLFIGTNAGSNSGLKAYLCEFIYFNRVLSTTEAAMVRAYLGRKWGITTS